MKVNMGSIDRIVRVVFAVILVLFILIGMVSGITAIVFGSIALVLFLTGIFSRCLLYYPLGISTNSTPPAIENAENTDGDKQKES